MTRVPAELAFAGTSRFVVQRKLGEGGMGVVYEAHDRDQGIPVALKMLRHIDAASVSRFKGEFRALADLAHPNLVRLGELFCEDSQWFFTMELLEGKSFVAHVREVEGSVPYDEVRLRAALAQLAVGVSALHRANLVHRDIKPSNVLVTDPGRVVLLDFGLATDERDDRHDRDTGVYGTATYMAPEQGASQLVGPAADWYSVGVVLYEALTGRPPFSGTPLEILLCKEQRVAPSPRILVSHVPPDLDLLCQELLRRDPSERPPEREVLERLGVSAAEGEPDSASIPSLTSATFFVGREHELLLLAEAFQDSYRERRAVTLFVHGESGLGKSALVRHFLLDLQGRTTDLLVLWGRCYEREMVPYKAFDGLVEALGRYLSRLAPARAAPLLPRDIALLARVFPALRQVAWVSRVAAPSVPNPQELRTRAFVALRELLVQVAERQPLVLAIDDFQWADGDSLNLFYELTHPPDSPPFSVFVTARTTSEADPKGPLSSILALPGDVRHIHLSPLSPSEAARLAESALPPSAQRSQEVEVLAREAGGHPLFLLELARYAAQAGAQKLPAIRLDDALWSRILRLNDPGRTLLEILAVASAPVLQATAGRAAQLGAAELTPCISLLRAANLCRTTGPHSGDLIETYHDRVREAVLAHLPAETQKLHHGRLADALEATRTDDSDRTSLVRHLEAIGETVRAATHAERAAQLASEAFAFDQAVLLLRTALRLGVHAQEPTRALYQRLGDALANAGRGGEAADAYQRAAAGAQDAVALDLERRAAEQLLLSGHVDEGLGVLAQVLANVGMKLQSSPSTALASLLLRRAWLRVRGRSYRRREESAVPVHVLSRLDACWTAAMGLAAVHVLRGADFQTQHFVLALRAGEPYRIARSLGGEAAFLATAGHRDRRRAIKLAEEALALAQEIDNPHAQAIAYIASGVTALMDGRWKASRTFCEKANEALREHCTGVAWEIATTQVTWVTCLFYLGEVGEFARRVTTMLREAEERGDRYAATLMRTGVAVHLWLLREQPDLARQHAEEATRNWSRHGFFVHYYLDLRAHVEIDLYCGEALIGWDRLQRRWRDLARSHLLYVQQFRTEMYSLRARTALAAAGDPRVDAPTRTRLLGSAEKDVRRVAREKMPWSDALALLLSAGIAARRGDARRAIERLTLAATAFDAVDMVLHATCARRRLGELVAGDNGPALIQKADAWLAKQGIKTPERIIALLAPGFPLRGQDPVS